MNNKIYFAQIGKGTKLVLTNQKGAKSFTLGLNFSVGTRDENGFPNGIAHFIEHAIFRGSKKLSAKEISVEFEKRGAYLNAFTTKESVCFYARSLNYHFEDILNLLTEICFKPQFPEEEILKEKEVIKEEIKSTYDDYEDQIFDIADTKIFKGHELAKPIAGTIKSVNSISVENLKDFYMNVLLKSELCISIVGDFDWKDLNNKVSKGLSKNLNRKVVSNTNDYKPKKISIKDKITRKQIASFQSHLMIAASTHGFNHEEKLALLAGNYILGEGMSSYLYQELREKLGLTYNIYSTLTLYKDVGGFYIYTGLDGSNLEDASRIILKILKSIIKDGISKEEFNIAREQLKSGLIFETESQSFLMQYVAKQVLFADKITTIEEEVELIDKLKKDNLNDALRYLLNEENLIRIDLMQKNSH